MRFAETFKALSDPVRRRNFNVVEERNIISPEKSAVILIYVCNYISYHLGILKGRSDM